MDLEFVSESGKRVITEANTSPVKLTSKFRAVEVSGRTLCSLILHVQDDQATSQGLESFSPSKLKYSSTQEAPNVSRG